MAAASASLSSAAVEQGIQICARPAGPHFDVLIDMAIADRRHDDVLRWYDAMSAGQKQRGSMSWYGSDGYGDRVAAAVAESHPERSLAIYRQRVDDHLPHASASAYEAVAGYLRKMRPILQALHRERRVERIARGHSLALQEPAQVHGDSRQTGSQANCGAKEGPALDRQSGLVWCARDNAMTEGGETLFPKRDLEEENQASSHGD